MTLPELILICVVFFIGVPSAVKPSHDMRILAFRNWTAAALVASWAFGWSVYLGTGEGMPIDAMVIADLFVLTVILSKAESVPAELLAAPEHPPSLRQLLLDLWSDLGPWDRGIVTIFPVMWAIYALPVSDFHRWWALWWLSIAQFALAAGEPLNLAWRKANASRAEAQQGEPPGLEFRAWGPAAHV